MSVYAVTVGVALQRPPQIHEYRRYVLAEDAPLDARLLACQWAAITSVMPVWASQPVSLHTKEQ